jgi:hypothetical protein
MFSKQETVPRTRCRLLGYDEAFAIAGRSGEQRNSQWLFVCDSILRTKTKPPFGLSSRQKMVPQPMPEIAATRWLWRAKVPPGTTILGNCSTVHEKRGANVSQQVRQFSMLPEKHLPAPIRTWIESVKLC